EDKDTGEGSAEVRDAGIWLVHFLWGFGNGEKTYVARRVMYVPPMAGSAIFAWKAETATNITVLVNVEKTCSQITTMRYHVPTTPSLGKIITVNCAMTAARRRPRNAQSQSRIGEK